MIDVDFPQSAFVKDVSVFLYNVELEKRTLHLLRFYFYFNKCWRQLFVSRKIEQQFISVVFI